MKKALKFTVWLNRIHIFLTCIFFLFVYSSYEINNQLLRIVFYLGFLFFSPTIFIWNVYFYKPKLKRFSRIIFPLIGYIYLFYANPLEIFNAANTWETEEVLYVNKLNSGIKIESQKQELFTSNKINTRTVIVTYYTKYFIKSKRFIEVHMNKNEWTKINNDE